MRAVIVRSLPRWGRGVLSFQHTDRARLEVSMVSRAIFEFTDFGVRHMIKRVGTAASIVPADIVSRIVTVRGQRVLFDSDLAAMYGVTVKRLNQQVNRNIERFPADFIFHLEPQELTNLKLRFATSSLPDRTHGGARRPPRMLTEHGAIMAATVLSSPRAVQMSVYIVRAFVKLREVLASNTTLARRLEALERSVASLDSDTRKQFDQVYEAILGLMGAGSSKN